MAVYPILAALQVLGFIAIAYAKNTSGQGSDEVNCTVDVEGQPPKGTEVEIDPTTHKSRPEVHEPQEGVAAQESGRGAVDKIVPAPECPTARVGPWQVRQRGSREVSHSSNEDLEAQLGRRSSGDNIPLGVAPEDSEAYENEGEASKKQRYEGTEAEEEMKRASKVAYFSTGIAGSGIIGIFSGYPGDQTGHAHAIHLKVFTFFMLATFISGGSTLLLTWLHRSCPISIKTFKNLKYTTLVLLTLAMFDVCFISLKFFAILSFVPVLFIVTISFFTQ